MLFDNIGRRFYINNGGKWQPLPEGDTPFNLQSNTFYADSEEKFLRSVILYSKTQIQEAGPYVRLYYDKDCTRPVLPDDLLNMFLKVKIGIIKYGTDGGSIYYPLGIVNFKEYIGEDDESDYSPAFMGLVMPDGDNAIAFVDPAPLSEGA